MCLGLLAACAQPADPESLLPPIPRAAPGPVSPDGNYNGQLVMSGSVGGMGDECGDGDTFTLSVRGGKFRYVLAQPQVPYRRQLQFDVTVAPDGSFDTTMGASYMRGRFAQGHMQGQITGDACTYDMEADRNGTW